MGKVIKGLTIICTAMALTACGSGSSDSSEVTVPDTTAPTAPTVKVVVIGAGMSGIKAAHKLLDAGFEVQVLEGRDRIGGRTYSNKSMGGTPLDVGASWIHGIEGNPIHDLATQLNVPLFEWDYDNQVIYDHQGNIDHQSGN